MAPRITKVALLAAACACALAQPRDVRACHNGVELRVDPRVQAVAEAERLVAEDKAEAAAKRVLAADPGATKRAVGREPLADRELIVLARAAVRSQGRVYHGHGTADPPLEQRQQALRWAVQIFKELRVRRNDDPAVMTDLGEAQSLVPDQQHEALAALASLERKDLVATAQGYAALAALRADEGRGAAPARRAPLTLMSKYTRELELARCEQMTKTPSVCERQVAGG